MTLTRRDLMAGSAMTMAGAALLGSTRPAAAAAPLAGSEPVGFYRFKVGDLEVTLVNDGFAKRPLDDKFVKNAPLADVQKALADSFQATDSITIPFTTTIVNTGKQLVMIDSGNGQLGAPTSGKWHANFKAAGYSPDQVDLIIVSHFHGDHINGIRDKEGKAVFPNAKVTTPEAEWGYWMDDATMSRAPEAMQGAFKNVRRVFEPIAKDVERYQSGKEIVPGIMANASYGHTPGHVSFIVSSGSGKLLVWSDTTNKPELFVRNPEWQAVFDMDGNMAAESRKKLCDMAAAEKMQVAGYHFPFPATGFIAKDGTGYRFVPNFWS